MAESSGRKKNKANNYTEKCSLYPEDGLNKQRTGFFMSIARPISYPTPRDGCVTSATITAKQQMYKYMFKAYSTTIMREIKIL
jgi:hypothetical protein